METVSASTAKGARDPTSRLRAIDEERFRESFDTHSKRCRRCDRLRTATRTPADE
ncbi:hypothetical protein [Natrinema salaciae]|uniref:hypothetical protein n=1 Tax=Natrinema salaciae TaxID=1186196 RepID=UPI0015874579|nr:hypothetical protein [Natrinema salaciae]